ncbi:MAG: hypothetical protein WCI17_08300, partial [bacterium]
MANLVSGSCRFREISVLYRHADRHRGPLDNVRGRSIFLDGEKLGAGVSQNPCGNRPSDAELTMFSESMPSFSS